MRRPMGAVPCPRAQTLASQGLANLVARELLRTPLLCRVVGARLTTIYVVGRKPGRHYAVKVAHTRNNGALLVGTPFGWGTQPAHRRGGGHAPEGQAATGRHCGGDR